MQIIKKAKVRHTFKVLEPFVWHMGKITIKGQEIEITDPGDQVGYCLQGRVVPSDLPEVTEYICLDPFTLPGMTEKFKAEKLEVVKIKASDALPLLLGNKIIPRDDSQWRPYGRRLKTKQDEDREIKKKIEEDKRKIFPREPFY